MGEKQLQENSNPANAHRRRPLRAIARTLSLPFRRFSLLRGDLYHGRTLHNYSNDLEALVGGDWRKINQGGAFKEDLVKAVPSFQSFDFEMFKRTYQASFYYQGVSGVKLGKTTIDETCDNAIKVLANQNLHSEYTRVFKAAVNLNYELVLLEALHNLPLLKYRSAGEEIAVSEPCQSLCATALKGAIAFRLQDIKFDEKDKIFRNLVTKKPIVPKFIKNFFFRYNDSNDILSSETQRKNLRGSIMDALSWGEEEAQAISSLSPAEHQILAWHMSFAAHAREITKLLGILFASSLTEEETEGEKVSETLKGIIAADLLANVKQIRYLVRRDIPKYIEEKAGELSSIYDHLNAIITTPVSNKMAQILIDYRSSPFHKALIKYMKFEQSKLGRALDRLTWYSLFAESASAALGIISPDKIFGTIGDVASFLRGDPWTIINNMLLALFLTKLPGQLLLRQDEKNSRSKLL